MWGALERMKRDVRLWHLADTQVCASNVRAENGRRYACIDANGFMNTRPLGELGRQIRHHGIEHRKSGLRHPQSPVGVDNDGAFLAQHGDPVRIERAAR
jgi:hypothetical protein